MKRLVLALALGLVFIALPAAALPDQGYITWYYDESGDIVGYYWSACGSGYYMSGEVTEISHTDYDGPCETLEPLACQDFGMSTMGGCGSNYCVSEGYMLSYGMDMVEDCHGICKWGEGPGAAGDWYRPTCAQTGVACDPVKLGRACP